MLLVKAPPTFDEAVMMKKEKQVETKEDPNDPLLDFHRASNK